MGLIFRHFGAFGTPLAPSGDQIDAQNRQSGAKNRCPGGVNAPGPLQKRIRDTTSIFHGFDIDLGRQFGDILKVLVPRMIILTGILQQFLL